MTVLPDPTLYQRAAAFLQRKSPKLSIDAPHAQINILVAREAEWPLPKSQGSQYAMVARFVREQERRAEVARESARPFKELVLKGYEDVIAKCAEIRRYPGLTPCS